MCDILKCPYWLFRYNHFLTVQDGPFLLHYLFASDDYLEYFSKWIHPLERDSLNLRRLSFLLNSSFIHALLYFSHLPGLVITLPPTSLTFFND